MNIKTDLFQSDIHYIYLTTNLVNNKKYIGQRKIPERCEVENDKYLGSGTLLLKAVEKYGREKFKKEILEICYSQQEADRLENLYFEKYDVLNKKDVFYNRGLAGQKWRPDYHKSFMSNRMKEYYKDENNLKNWFEKSLKKSKKWQNKTFEEFLIDRKNNDKRKKIIKINGKQKGNKILLAISRFKNKKFTIEEAREYIKGVYLTKTEKNNKVKRINPKNTTEHLRQRAKEQWSNPDIKKKRLETMRAKSSRLIIVKDGIETIYCKECKQYKPLDLIVSQQRKTDTKKHYRPYCKECRNKIDIEKKDRITMIKYTELNLKCDKCNGLISFESYKHNRNVKRCKQCR